MNKKLQTEGTYILSGIIQGPLPAGSDGETKIRSYAQKISEEGLRLSLRVDGPQFSLLADEDAHETFAPTPFDMEEGIRNALQRLIELYPNEARMGLLSTIRSQIYEGGREHQSVYAVVYPGTFEVQRGSVVAELLPRRKRISFRAKLGLGFASLGLLAGGVYLTTFWVDYSPLINSAKAHWSGTEAAKLKVDESRVKDAVKTEIIDVSNLRSVVRIRISRGTRWEEFQKEQSDSVDAELDKALRVNRYLHVNFYDFRGELVTDQDGQVIAPVLSVSQLIKSPKAEIDLRLPPGIPVSRIVLLP